MDTAAVRRRLRSVDRRTVGLAVLAGAVHAAVLLAVAARLGYPVGPGAFSPAGLAWHYGGLVAAAAVPAYLRLRYGLLAPAALALAVAAYVVHAEVTPPGPTFLALEGFFIVKDGLYVRGYATRWYAPTAAFVHAGVIEAAVRADAARPTDERTRDLLGRLGERAGAGLGRPGERVGATLAARPTLSVAAVLAAGHATVAVAYAGGGAAVAPATLAVALPAGAVGALLVRHGLVAPYVVFLVDLLAALRANAGLAGADLTAVGAAVVLAAALGAGVLELGLGLVRRRLAARRTGTA